MTYQNVDASHELWYKTKCLLPKLTHLAMREWKEIIKISVKINEIRNRKTIEKINDTKNWFFEKTNKIEKPLARFIEEEKGEEPNY